MLEIYDMDNQGAIHLIKKKYFHLPDFSTSGEQNDPVLKYTKRNIPGFQSAAADNNYIYAIYASRTNEDPPSGNSWHCTYLLVYDWNGKAVKAYHLAKDICSMPIHKNTVYGLNLMKRKRMIYTYQIEKDDL